VNDFNLGITIGNSSDFLDYKARDFKGFFWGGSLSHKKIPNLEFVMDYDTRMINAAVRTYLWKRLHLLVGVMDLKKTTAVIAYRYTL
jgi:hypothetical protein